MASGRNGPGAELSLMFYDALRAAGVPAELHVLETGRHGFALGQGDPALSTWTTLCASWLRRRGWVKKRAPNKRAPVSTLAPVCRMTIRGPVSEKSDQGTLKLRIAPDADPAPAVLVDRCGHGRLVHLRKL